MKIRDYIALMGDILLSDTFDKFKRELDEACIHILHELRGRSHQYSTVLLLPSNKNDVMSKRVLLLPKHSTRVVFNPQRSISRGSWIVLLGPGSIKGVMIGNQCQTDMCSEDGPVFTLVDDHALGQNITVVLQGDPQ